ncbi:MAG TPA: MAPEG family protein [Candidatus Binatia bacterium]|nr:MAPEG family protein [Candidatus Binatia bacterium]
MNASAVALLGFAAWTLALVALLLFYRTALVFSGRSPANAWMRGTTNPGDPALVVRMLHAHQNCLESLPVFAAIVIGALILNKTAVTDAVAMWVLYARFAQSATHLAGTSHWLVMVRATFFSAQLALFAWMLWGLLH